MIEEIAVGKYAICNVEELKKLAKDLINSDRYYLAEEIAAIGGFPLEENPTIIKIKRAIASQKPFRISYLDAARRSFNFDCAYAQISTYENKQYLEVNYFNDVESDSPPPLDRNRILRLSRIPHDSQILKLDTEWKDLNYLEVKFRLSGNLAAGYRKK
ncbi:hypothetical protein, partial [Anaplasma marginale]|uniref:hypothetical protein n=1 Tax=Anaplasma marginale TaxID=770 RepID=UPI0005B3A316